MNFGILILEIVILAVLMCVFCVILEKNPESMVEDYPPEIQAEYYKTHEKREADTGKAFIIKKLISIIIAGILFALMAHWAGAKTFLQGFLVSFLYVVVMAAADTFIMDWIFFPRVKKWRLPGTEHMDREYHQKWFHLKGVLKVAPLGLIYALLCSLVMLLLFH